MNPPRAAGPAAARRPVPSESSMMSRSFDSSAGSFTRCSEVSAELGESLAGTAPHAKAWIALEHDGPWAARVFDACPSWIHDLVTKASAARVGLLLIRKPGRRPQTRSGASRALIATTLPGAAGLEQVTLARPEKLAALDLDALAAGSLPGWGEPQTAGALLICTNGKRDRCCAIAGRALALQICASRPDQVWECTHLGGHRFAPTGLFLPSGYAYGRLTYPEAISILDSPDSVPHLARCRGRTTWDSLGQVAELTVRVSRPPLAANALSVSEGPTGANDRVVHSAVDGSRTVVTVARTPTAMARPISCDAEPSRPLTVNAGLRDERAHDCDARVGPAGSRPT